MLRTHTCGQLRETDIGKPVILSGWVNSHRDHGGLLFIDLRDRYGITQICFKSQPDEKHRTLKNEDVIQITGEVVGRGKHVNPKLKTGNIEVVASSWKLLNSADFLPISPSETDLSGEDVRYKYRYLDLRRPEMSNRLVFRHQVVACMRNFLQQRDFIEVETPILYKSTPEGAREFLVPSRLHSGEFYALPQSPQLFKQLLMVGGADRYMQIARCFRDEGSRSDRQLEFTQLDLELSFIECEDVISLISDLLSELWKKFLNCEVTFPRLTYQEAIDKYGIDRPDLRYGLEIQDITDLLQEMSAEGSLIKSLLTDSNRVKALIVPDVLSRKEIDAITETVKQLGGKGLFWAKKSEISEFSGSLIKFTGNDSDESFKEDFDWTSLDRLLSHEETLLLLIDQPKLACKIMGEVRQQLAKQLALIPPNVYKFVWITDFPSFEYDAEAKRYVATHHPFTAPNIDPLLLNKVLETDPTSLKAQAYDIVLNGFELGGGSIRIHNTETQKTVFKFLGISEEDAEKKFGFLLEALKSGAPPHGGIALGVDRLLMLMTGSTSIKDVIAFPKVQSGRDLMTGAPSTVLQDQLDDVHIKVSKS